MQKSKKFYEAKTKIPPNTIIRGIGAVVNTPSLLASKFKTTSGGAYSSSNIKNFKIVGDDIFCNIIANYRIANAAFQNNTSLVSYDCFDGFLKQIESNGFRGCSNLLSVNFIGCTDVSLGTGYQAFYLCTSLINVLLPSCTWLGTQSFQECTALTTLNLPSVTGISVNVFQNMSSVLSINMPLCSNLGSGTGNNNVFLNIKTGCTITVPIALQTINAGAPDGDLVYASGTRGATIVYT